MAFWSMLTRRPTLKANEYGPLLWILVLAAVSAAFMSKGNVAPRPSGPYQPLEGALYSGPMDGFPPTESTHKNWPEVVAYVDDLTRLGLDQATQEFRVKVSQDPKTRYKWLLRNAKPRSSQRIRPSRATPPDPLPRNMVGAAPTDFTFAFLDGILQKDESTYILSARFQKADITFRLDALGFWRDLYLLKVAVTNGRNREFFITSVEIEGSGKSVQSRLYIPFSCAPGETVEGIVTFQASAVKNQKVAVILIEGGTPRQYAIKDLHYAF